MASDSEKPSEDDDLYDEPTTAEDADGLIAALFDIPDVEPPLRPGQTLGEHFTVVRELGAGGMGRVYLAFDNALDRAVAIKVHREEVDGEAIARMRGEAKAIARLSHPNVVGVFEVGLFDGRMFIVMEYIDGERLDRWQVEPGRDWRSVLAAYVQAGHALVAAHRAGLVHRDFKPQNVMVVEDGDTVRVRVLDFGLARALETPIDGVGDLRDGLQTDGRVGTPAYVAPEQRFDGTVSPAADQYSFAVSLWEGLCGQRPPSGVLDGFHAPRWVLDAVRRGWAEDPEARWPSMRDLLDALAADPAVRRRRIGTLVGALALIGIGGLGARALADDAGCPAPQVALGDAWDADRQAAVAAAFGNAEVAYAEQALTDVQTRLDDYASAWMQLADASCKGEDGVPAGLRPRAALCIDHRRRDFAALTEAMAGADTAAVEQAVDAVEALRRLDGCTDLERLSAQVAEPEAADAAAVERTRSDLARLSARARLGRPLEVLGEIQSLVETASTMNYRPLVAEVRHEQGRIQEAAGALTEAEASYRAAYAAAVASGHDRIALRSAQALIAVVGHDLARPAEGHEWAFHAEALHGRPAAKGLEPQTWGPQGTVFKDQGRYAESAALYGRALEAIEANEDATTLELADAVNSVGTAYAASNDYEQAREVYARALELYESELPADHPRVALVLGNLSTAHEVLGDYDTALALLERTRQIRERALPPTHPSHGDTQRSLGTVLVGMGRYDEAEQAYQRAVDLMVESRGADHPRVANTLVMMGSLYAEMRRLEDARAAITRAVELLDGTDGGQAFLPSSVLALGNVNVELGRMSEGIEHLERAAKLYEVQDGPNSAGLSNALTTLGVAQIMQDEPEAALEFYERARRLDENAGRPVHWTLWLNIANVYVVSDNDEKAAHFTYRALEAREAEVGPEHPSLVGVLYNLGYILEGLDKPGEAKAAYERSLRVAEKAGGQGSASAGLPLEGLGALALNERRYADAVGRLRRALEVLEGAEAPARIAEIRFLLARALWGEGSLDDAVKEAERARTTYASVDAQESKIADIDAWLTDPKRRRRTKTR